MSSIKGFIIDLDGTVYLQDSPIPGAIEAINRLYEQGHKICFLTNNPTRENKFYYQKLKNMGLHVSLNDVLSATYITTLFFQQIMEEKDRLWVEGEPALRRELQKAGLAMASSPLTSTMAVLGGGPSFTFNHLNNLYQAYLKGAKMYATNSDLTCPLENEKVPDTGAWIAALESLMGENSFVEVIGKPSSNTAKTVLRHLNLSPEDCYVVGDRLDTDILLAQQNGMKSVLVLTGVTSLEDLKNHSGAQPNYVLKSLPELTIIE
ncbi:HAD family hydrolase [Salipaludibacillus keqinensis]|uniref:HAD family hydrolase n=1 Tax=Salipaludibacillus keqinensis TaxID=2045207 RepID=A0A323TIV9_9BACI|nr:HAD-IIA family hydrolase [Salipaludibacillus keqinensis]PYZ92613.1 HAD family hydrolase [Salipaludibacillus keqinensis]